MQARPDWSAIEIVGALRESGDYYRRHGEPYPLYVHGYGIPDLALAVALEEY